MSKSMVVWCMGILLVFIGSAQSVTIYAAKDTFLDQNEYSENYGADNSLSVRKDVDSSEDDDKTTLLQFDIINSIPENAVITSAKLSLYYYDDWYMPNNGHYLTVGAYPLLQSWAEGYGGSGTERSGASWKYRNPYWENQHTWDADGARGSGDRGALDAEINIYGNAYGSKEWSGQNVTDTVAAWYALTIPNFGWVMDYSYSNDDENEVIFWSNEGGGIFGPKLDVDYYIIPEPTTICLLGLGGFSLIRSSRRKANTKN